MPINKIIKGAQDITDTEKIKSVFNVKGYIEEIQKMGYKKFWIANNKVIYLITALIVGLILYQMFRTSRPIMLCKTDPTWSLIYFSISTLIFAAITFFIIQFTFTISIKQDYNTDNFMRTKMSKLKGIDWKSAEEPFQKKKKQ